MFEIFQNIVSVVATFVTVVGAPILSTSAPTPTPVPQVQQSNITVVKKSYSYQGFSVNVTLEIPNNGGQLKGTVDGVCNGIIDGTYDGEISGDIKGQANGTCSILLIKKDAKADFSGKLFPSKKEAQINYTGNAGDLSHSGSLTLTY